MRLHWTRAPIVENLFSGRDFGPSLSLAIFDGNALQGGVVIHDWNPEAGTVEISGGVITPRAPFRAAARAVADHVFRAMECQAAIWRTSEHNRAVRKLARSMGGQEFIIPRLRGRNEAEALILFTDEAWQKTRWSRHEIT